MGGFGPSVPPAAGGAVAGDGGTVFLERPSETDGLGDVFQRLGIEVKKHHS